jgi:opine dehydrogenase
LRVAILGAGAGGAAAVAELCEAGHEVALWNRSRQTLEPFERAGGVEYAGVLGTGLARPRLITSDLAAAVKDAEAIVCTLPTFLHGAIAGALADVPVRADVPLVLNPGHTGGALEFRAVFAARGRALPPVAEFSTLTYVARKLEPHRVTVTGRANRVRAAALPGGESALEMARTLFPAASPVRDVIAVGLSNMNMVLHPPGAVLSAAWVEARSGDFTFYVDAMTPGVARVMKALDEERLAVARAYGHELPNLVEEMQAIGTVHASVTDTQDYAAAISGGEANRRIKAPSSLAHRYYVEDFGHGLLPFMVFAGIAGVPVPIASSLFALAESLVGKRYREGGRTAEAMGIAGLDRDALLARVRSSTAATAHRGASEQL